MSADGAVGRSGSGEVVAEDGAYQVYRCPAGCVHVRMAGVTVRMNAAEYRRFAGTVVDALVRMEVRSTLGAPPWRQ